MSWIKKTWQWLDGKKTVIGSVALIVSDYLPRHTVAYAVLSIIGQITTGVGLVHKAEKSEKLPSGLRKVSNQIKSMAKKK